MLLLPDPFMESPVFNAPETTLLPSRAEWDRLLQRVIDSQPFRRSTRLREFLVYVGNQVVLHGAKELPEQQIGVAVFERSPSYDTSQDNIVRVNAMELRKRIGVYFETEGQNEPLIFEIPRGSYLPVFRLRAVPPAEPAFQEPVPTVEEERTIEALVPELSLDKVPAEAAWHEAFRTPVVLALLVLILGLTVWVIVASRQLHQEESGIHKWQSQPAMRDFWGNFFGKKLAPDIVIADSSFVLAQSILHRKLSLAEYLNFSYRTAQSPEALSSDARQQQMKDLAAIFDHSSGSLADFRVARRITELETGDFGTRLVFAREYAGHRLRWNNTIFVGSSRSNPWVELYEDRMAYHFKESTDSSPSAVTIDKPVGNERAEYPLYSSKGTPAAYCIIVFVPNPTKTGNTLIIAGSDSQATEAGGTFSPVKRTSRRSRRS
ncbi:hypothetical protein ACFQBQ_16745 [Granulicella cerasi]|uniref:Uncharacterized protein n=1 Tax=Granulicella cerasi TaxID=741063 RepID=A0ABW1ZE91_9BACT